MLPSHLPSDLGGIFSQARMRSLAFAFGKLTAGQFSTTVAHREAVLKGGEACLGSHFQGLQAMVVERVWRSKPFTPCAQAAEKERPVLQDLLLSPPLTHPGLQPVGWCHSHSEKVSLGLSGNLRVGGVHSHSSKQGQSLLLTSKAHMLESSCSLTSGWDPLPFSL